MVNQFGRKYLTSKFCSTDCYREWRSKARKRDKQEYVKRRSGFPKYTCQNCGFKIQLDFEPLREPNKLSEIVCPKCIKSTIKFPLIKLQ